MGEILDFVRRTKAEAEQEEHLVWECGECGATDAFALYEDGAVFCTACGTVSTNIAHFLCSPPT